MYFAMKIPIQYINENYNLFLYLLKQQNYENIKHLFIENRCHALLKSGTNKNMQCKKQKKYGLFCPIHNK